MHKDTGSGLRIVCPCGGVHANAIGLERGDIVRKPCCVKESIDVHKRVKDRHITKLFGDDCMVQGDDLGIWTGRALSPGSCTSATGDPLEVVLMPGFWQEGLLVAIVFYCCELGVGRG